MAGSDLARIKENVAKMAAQGAPIEDIDGYIAAEGTTVEAVRDFQPGAGGGAADPAMPADPAADQGSGLGSVVQQFGERFNRGLYSTLNAPTALANAATNALGIDYQFKRPLEAAAPSLDRMAMEVPEATTPGQRLAGTVGEFMGANALPAGGMIAAAPRIAAATANSGNLAGQVTNRIAGGIAAAPGTAAAGEALSSVGAGLGASMAEGQGANAEYLAAVAGGFAAPALLAVSPTNLARKGINAARKKINPQAVEAAQRKAIADGVRQSMTPDSQAAIADTAAIQRDIPDYRPSVAEATENPSFIATQQAFERELSGPDLDQAIARYRVNDQAIDTARQGLAPQSSLTVDDAFNMGARRIDRTGQKINNRLTALDRDAADISDNLISPRRQRELGGTIRTDLIGRRDLTKQQMSELAQSAGLNDTTPRYPFAQAKQRLIQSAAARSPLEDSAALPSGILADIRNAPDNVSISDLMALRTRVSTDIREAMRTPSGEKRVPYLQKLKAEIDGVTDDLIARSNDPELGQRLQSFRRTYLEDYVQTFEQGAAAKVLRTDSTGAYAVPDEKVASEFFNGWSQSAADQFNKAFPSAASANAAMEAAAMDSLYSHAVRGGIVDPSLVDSWVRKNRGVLDAFPNIKQNVAATQQALDRIATRRATLNARKQQMESSVLAREVARIENATTTPEAAIGAAIRNPQRMAKLVKGVQTTAAKNAIARQVWDTALSSPNPGKFLQENAAGAKVALGPRYETAMRLARAIEKNRLVPRPAGQAMDTNPMASVEGALGTGLNQISSRIFAVKSGRTSARYALADIAGRAFRTMTARQSREFLREAIYDPQIARDLATTLETGGSGVTEAQIKRLYTFVLSSGIAADARYDEQGNPL